MGAANIAKLEFINRKSADLILLFRLNSKA